MEATTPPNTTGFNRKPKSKNRKFNLKPGRRKSGYNPTAAMPSEATAWLYGSMFLMAGSGKTVGGPLWYQVHISITEGLHLDTETERRRDMRP